MKYQKNITDSIVYRAVCDECLKKKFVSELSCGMYCAARLRFSENGQFLIIALDRRGKILNESFFIPEEFYSLPESCTFFTEFAKSSKADSLIIAGNFDKSKKFEIFKFSAACACLISKALLSLCVSLKGFYLVTGFNFKNVAPQNLKGQRRRIK